MGDRRGVSRVWWGSVSHQWANMPPRPTDASWAGSPTATRRHRLCRTRSTIRARSAVAAMPASSRITVVPSGMLGLRACWWRARNPARVSVRQLASVASTSAALPDGASPITCRRCARRALTACAVVRVLPVPAGPTTRTSGACPAIAADACSCESCPGFGWTVLTSAQRCSSRSWSSTAPVVKQRSVTCSVTGRPSRRCWVVSVVRVRAPRTRLRPSRPGG